MIVAALLLCCSSIVFFDGWAISFNAELGKKEVTYVISETKLKSGPQWDDSEPNPPLSPRKAIEIGFEALEKFRKQGDITHREPGFVWRLKKVTLVNTHEKYWYYEVAFKEEVEPGFGASGKRDAATVVVLFDQTVVDPNIKKDSLEK